MSETVINLFSRYLLTGVREVVKEIYPHGWSPQRYLGRTLGKTIRGAIVDNGWSCSGTQYLGSGILIGRARKGWWIIAYRAQYTANKHGIIVKAPYFEYVAFRIRDEELAECLVKAYMLNYGYADLYGTEFKVVERLPEDIEKKLRDIAHALICGREDEVAGLIIVERTSRWSVNPWYYVQWFTTDKEQLERELKFVFGE